MATTRNLFGVFLAGLLGAPAAFGQSGVPGPAAGGGYLPPPPASPGVGSGYAAPPQSPGSGGPTAVLTAPPGAVPPGVVPSPWCGPVPAGAACCGPVGANGPVTYELYTRTGPSLIVGGSADLTAATHTGWMVAGGGRTLLFNTPGTAAWVLDLGISYAYNGGNAARILNVFSPAPRNAQGQLTGPDVNSPFTLRSLRRSNFNYAVGRDWFLNGPGTVGRECSWNSRIGFDVGGRWGTNHVDLIPVANPAGYLRRQGVSESVFVGLNWTWDVPMGAWILFAGGRAEWGYTWTNLIPPSDGNIQDVNLLGTIGVRF